MAGRPDQQAAKAARQAKVAALRLGGLHSQAAVARALGEHPVTVHRDFKDLDTRWQSQADADTKVMKGIQHERLEAMIRGLWPEASRGTWPAVDRVLGCLERQAKLFGLDAPAKVDIEPRIRATAVALGLDPDEAVAEARRILAASRKGG